MKMNEDIFKCAICTLREKEIVTNGGYDSQYNSYISSFGAAIIQSGLLPAVIFFENEDSGAEKGRHLIIDAIKYLLEEHFWKEKRIKPDEKLSEYLLKNNNASEILEQITMAATALKLALRIFKKKQ